MRRTIEWAILAGGVASLALAVTATVARAENMREWRTMHMRSVVILDEPQVPGALATLTFHNDATHTGDAQFELTWQGVNVVVFFSFNYAGSADRVDVAPPDGMVAEPPFVVVEERGAPGQIHIFAAAPGA